MTTAILKGLIKLADDVPGSLTVQVEDMEADTPDDELEMLEPVGVHFLPSLDDDVLVFEVNGSPDHRVVMGATQRGHRPQDLTAAGTGGLHYLGNWRVFLDDDGTVHLGERDPADFVALASLVKAELDDIKADFDALKSAFDAHTHLYSPGPSPSAPTAPPATPAPTPHTPGEVASAVVKAV
jgi:hypothetical protein